LGRQFFNRARTAARAQRPKGRQQGCSASCGHGIRIAIDIFQEVRHMSLFKKDRIAGKPDFSNVEKGSSTTSNRSHTESTGSTSSAPPVSGRSGPDFSNVQSGGSSTAPTREAAAATTYVVRSGDSLSRIAKRHYGNAKLWPRIYEANRALIGDDPDLIQPGQSLVLPQL
jgi:nucleoid-associated protein YgaU